MRVAWEGDFEAMHSLAIVNRAVCRGLIDRGHDVRLIAARPVRRSGPTSVSSWMPDFASDGSPLPAPTRPETRYPSSTPRCMCGIAGRR